MSNTIKVICRFRPFNSMEIGTDSCIQSISENTVEIMQSGYKKKYDFDHIFEPKTT
jgi:hypothetical protein